MLAEIKVTSVQNFYTKIKESSICLN